VDAGRRGREAFLEEEIPTGCQERGGGRFELWLQIDKSNYSHYLLENLSVTVPSAGLPKATWLDCATEQKSAEINDID
jgi:hypothetical protein